MQNLLAVYTPNAPITSLRFARIAAESGYAVRFVNFGVYVTPEKFRGHKASLAAASETYLLCGWQEPGNDHTSQFDAAGDAGDRDAIGTLLKEGDISWVELYTDKFDYQSQVKRFPKNQAGIDGSVSKLQLPLLRSAKARYIFQNKSRRKASGEFMASIAEALARSLDGVVANFVRPSR